MTDSLTCWWESPSREGAELALCYSLPVVPCTSFTFKCSSNVCIGKENPECDGIADCSNGFDEHNCGKCCFAALFYITSHPSATINFSWATLGPTGALGQPLVVQVLPGLSEPIKR